MKYSVQQMQQALKDGKTIFFEVPYGKVTKYKANLCPNPELVVVSWTGESGNYNDVVYKLMTFIGSFDNGWICTKLEGEENMEKKTPHKHAELIKKWADGAIIQLKQCNGEWVNTAHNDPSWCNEIEYRVKPTLVKKWKWVVKTENNYMSVTNGLYATPEDYFSQNAYAVIHNVEVLQKVDSTMIEVEE